MLNLGGGVVGMRSPTPRRMGGIIEMTTAAVTDTARGPSRSGVDLLRMDGALSEEDEDEETEKVYASHSGWRRVDFEEKDNPLDIKLYELRTPKKSRQRDGQWSSPSRISRFNKTSIPGTPGSLESDTSSDTETTPASPNVPTPRTPFTPVTPVSPLRKLTRSPQPLSEALRRDISPSPNPILPSRSSFPLSSSQKKPASPPPTSFNSSRFISQKNLFEAPVEVFNNDPDPFAAPELGAIVRESQFSLLREDSDQGFGDGCDQVQTATRMSAWGNLTLPVPKEKRSPGIGLRRAVSDNSAAALGNLAERPESPSAYSQETGTELHLHRDKAEIVKDVDDAPSDTRRHRAQDSHGSVSLVPIEEALLAQRLLRRLNRRAEDRNSGPVSGKQKKRGAGNKLLNGGRTGTLSPQTEESSDGNDTGVAGSASGGRSFLLGMAKGKFLGYGWSS
ncbi:hypothetical protein BT96DRAFT_985636 [Gymnopus androsaceus JB14]|uniref:Uncharacterized protein n=1 Tax=Gymnopus androsaceus JB14 TaxID=1447944 RepID=A0A6A4IHP6_9AGAR|nr:hypothetical protein BT96DRAFT_985636 [Gymnopus androsaceus JB14]